MQKENFLIPIYEINEIFHLDILKNQFYRLIFFSLWESRALVDPDGIIKDMFFCGDFYAKPVPVLREVEESLKGATGRK